MVFGPVEAPLWGLAVVMTESVCVGVCGGVWVQQVGSRIFSEAAHMLRSSCVHITRACVGECLDTQMLEHMGRPGFSASVCVACDMCIHDG